MIENLSKHYGKRCVLDNVSFQVSDGALFGLIGLNGIGKTTLIKIMLDLTRADAGCTFLFGMDSREARARQKIFYVPEKATPNRHLKGKEYIQLALEAYGHRATLAQMEESAQRFGLDASALTKSLKECSKGMGQKLALMAAFLSPAPCLILDEPMSGLDPLARHCVKRAMREAIAHGRTIFFSSHILADMDEICSEIVIIHDSTLRYQGTPQGLRNHGATGILEEVFLQTIGVAA